MRIANAGHAAMVTANKANQTVLAGMRRNGFFAHRPDLALGKFVRSDTQSWCKDQEKEIMQFKEGSHRLEDSWLNERYDWLDEDVRPVHEDWTRCNKATEVNELGAPEQLKQFREVLVDAKFITNSKIIVRGKEITVPVID